ncbi:hypothetical protein [Kosmotoga pacifica]|uniref:DUF5671 domain-containing protein n=1 Tax=Kosmotoga pacifica TaxID=1330330 RepID=A0A0G2Z814_9BACT|nr:hypothetical protein [Kosmotoga pacifica]AKI97702.1 hypothetical protein IX53_07605 [Kosmotoga pacifica]
MKFSTKKIYAYFVSLITLIMLITALWSFASAVIDFFIPSDYSIRVPYSEALPEETQQKTIKSEVSKRESLKDILQSLLRIGIILPFYLFHWKLAKKAEEH